jgi:hypothetical protein
MKKENRKGIRKSREKEKEKAAQPGRAPARLPPLTGGPRLSATVLPHARPLSLARCPVGPICRRQLLHPLALSLSVSRARSACRRAIAPRSLFSLSVPWASPVSSALSVRRRGPAHAHSRTSPGFSATTPTLASSSLLIAPPVPRAHPSPHFAQLHPLSRSALAASRRRRPAPASPTIQLAGVRAKPSRAPPQGETPVPVPNVPYCALCSSNFAFAGARPRRSAVLAWWLADLA